MIYLVLVPCTAHDNKEMVVGDPFRTAAQALAFAQEMGFTHFRIERL